MSNMSPKQNKFKWQPQGRKRYWVILMSPYDGMYYCDCFYTYKKDKDTPKNIKFGNCFRTKKEAEAKLKEIKKLLNG